MVFYSRRDMSDDEDVEEDLRRLLYLKTDVKRCGLRD